MKNIIANIVRGGKSLTYLAAAFAALATSSAWAATVSNWKSTSVGGSEESPYDIWAAANWDNGVGSGKHLNFDVSSLTYMTNTASITTRVGDYFRVNSGDFVFLGPIYCSKWLNNTANARVSVLKKGDWKVEGDNMVIGSAVGSTVAFTNETGNVEINGSNLIFANANGATASVVTKAGTWNVTGDIILAKANDSGAAKMTVEGGRVTAGGYLSVGQDGPSGGQVIVKSGATFTTGDKLVVAWHSKGELDIDGGEFDVGTTAHLCYSRFCSSDESEYGRIYIRNGGRLSASSLQYAGGSNATAPATITFDGGTLKAKAEGTLIQAHSNLTVTVGANGGTIDNGGFDIKIPAAISGSGGLVVKGGGSLTLSSDTITYNSKTILEAGTLLAVSNNTAAANILANGIELIGTPALNTDYTVFVCNKELTASDLDNVACATAEITKSIGADGKSIVVRFTAFKEFAPRYIGPENGSLSDAANWSPAVVPTSGNAYIPTETAANLTVGDTFSPSAITFLPGSAAVTISGTDLADIEAVTNLSFAVQTFANSVAFKDAYRVCCDICAVNFAGGATATCPAGDMVDNVASHMLMGNITFTNDWNCDYTLSNPYSVPNGSSLYGRSLTGTGILKQIVLSVDVGGYAEFADNVYTGYSCGRVHVNGEMVVKGRWIMKGTDSYAHVGFDGDSRGNGILRANGIWKGDENNNMTRACYIKPPHIYIGSDGLGAKSNNYAIHFDEGAHTVYATDNFEIFGNARDGNLWDWGIAIDKPVTFNTQGYTINWTAGADGTGALVKDGDGTLIFNPYGTRLSGAVTVKGGTLKVMSASGVSTGATTVKDSAILELASGATLGSSAVTLESGSTLALTATSSTFTALANTVNLPTGENEKATIRIDGQRLKTGDHPILSGIAADAADHVELDMTSAALDGRKRASLAVNGSNLVLTIKPSAMIIVIL